MGTKLKEWTVLSMLEWGTEYFKEKQIPDPRHSIEWLLAETLEIERLDLYLKFDRPLSQQELDTIRPLVKRRAAHEPLQYIVGFTDFMNAEIRVNPSVLIPRMETEHLCEIILDEYEDDTDAPLQLLDIGTGSGCIPVALKLERPSWIVSALDISEEALDVARQNARDNHTDIAFRKGDILNWQSLDFDDHFDVVVSNPPYVLPSEKDTLQKQVSDHEPARALFCDNMEEMYGSIIKCCEHYLKIGGTLYLEIHEHHDQTIHALFDGSHWKSHLRRDYQKKPRFIIANLVSRP